MPQLKYEYYIDLAYKKSDGTTTNIDQIHIKNLTIYKEYDKYNMPICTMNLAIDKNLADDIITNMKTSTMIMNMYKFQLDNDAAIKELYFNEEFSYLTDDDTNKTKDIDYAKLDDKEEDRDDVLRFIKLGLISKKLVDSNLKPNNATIYNSSMQNIVVDLLNIGEPLLIEPFTETELVPQLIIPPKESISQTLEYLNTVRVFYNTGYRFYMDFENIYLVSKSGTATPRKLDKYDTVKFNLSEIGSKDSLLEGFTDDDQSKSYIIDVKTTDIKYGKDNLTNKELNGFTAVIDASKSIQQDYMKKSKGFGGILGTYQNIMNVIDGIKTTSASVRNVVKNIHQATDTIKGNFNQIVEQANSVKSTVHSVVSHAEGLLRDIPKAVLNGGAEAIDEVTGGIINNVKGGDIKTTLQGIVNGSITMTTISEKSVETSEDIFGVFKEKFTGQIYHLENFKSLVGAISPINYTDNLSELSKQVDKIPEKKEESKATFNKSMPQFNSAYKEYIRNNKLLVDTIQNMPDQVTFVLSRDPQTKQPTQTYKADFRALKSHHEELYKNLNFSNGKLTQMTGFTEQMSNSLKLNANVGDGMTKLVDSTSDIPRDFSKQLLEGANTYVKSLNKTKDSIVAKNKDDFNKAKTNITQSFGALKSSLNTLYQSGSTAIDSFSDLSKVGSGGESMIDIALELTEVVEDLGKRKLIRIPNDNMGLIKNYKHALELKSTYLSLSKQQLDNSLFNINMKYIINNESKDHKEDTSEYLLMSKTEVYVNSGDRFVSTTNMDFAKLPKSTKENAKKI